MIAVYDFAQDLRRIDLMQKATLGPTDFGVSPVPAVVGTEAWWGAIRGGQLPSHTVEGRISKVLWGSMGDWPEFELVEADGTTSRWTREGDPTRYVEGLQVRVVYVVQAWKVPRPVVGDETKIVLSIEIEDSEARSDARPPGLPRPGGR